jgi:hypothetical protein
MLSSISNKTEPRTGMTALRKISAPSGTASGRQGRPDLCQYRRRRPDHGHRRGGANVSDQHGQAAAPRHIHPAAHRPGRRADGELPDPAAAVQEEISVNSTSSISVTVWSTVAVVVNPPPVIPA